jgi:hypothetical protein
LISDTAISVAFFRICPETAEDPDSGQINPSVKVSPDAAASVPAAAVVEAADEADVEFAADDPHPANVPAINITILHAKNFFMVFSFLFN